jgi:hypothetical protein
VVDFEYIRSTGAHGHHAVGVFDAFVSKQREIWIGSDRSGMIRESSGPVAFFTEKGRVDWERAGSPALEYESSVNLFAPGCMGGSRVRRARLIVDAKGLTPALAEHVRTLNDVQSLLAEAVVDAEFCHAVYRIARQMPGVEVVPGLTDQLGRAGGGLARVEQQHRIELVFATDPSELLGYQWFLAEPQPFAPTGTLHSWSAFLERKVVNRLPHGIPPIPMSPCEPI